MLVFCKNPKVFTRKKIYHKARIIPGVKAILPPLQLQMGASVSRGKITNLLVYRFSGEMILQKQDNALELKTNYVCITQKQNPTEQII